MAKHLAKCDKRAQTIEAAGPSKRPKENLWHVRAQEPHAKEFWLDLEMRGSATLETLDSYLRAIWLECCGHLSKFTVGGWHGYDIAKSRKADDVFLREPTLLHLYDFGTTSETEIQVIGSRRDRAVTRHPIVDGAITCRKCCARRWQTGSIPVHRMSYNMTIRGWFGAEHAEPSRRIR
jgi:hypothetical protein